MAKAKKLTQSEIDGVQYRKAKTWQVAVSQINNGSGMAFYSLMGLVSYLANEGYGIAVAVVGLILTGTRIFDAIIDPLAALIIDKMNTRFGKIRIVMAGGWIIRTAAVLLMFVWGSSGNHGIVLFVLMYLLYYVGATFQDIAGNMLHPVITNDPKQRPMVTVWSTIFNYFFPMVFNLVTTMVILPMYGNQYTVPMLATTCLFYVACSAVCLLISFIGITAFDKPENFRGITGDEKEDKVKVSDMLKFLKGNRPFQMFVVAMASDKLAQQAVGQAVVSTMLFGILVGNMQLGTLISMISMLPGILFAIVGGRYTGKFGSRGTVVTWTWICIGIAAAGILFCSLIDMSQITKNMVLMAGFFIILLAMNGAKMCVTTGSAAMRADIVDYELDRSGKYMPATVTATYNFIDKIITSFGAAITTGLVSLIGFKTVMPQPTDSPTTPIFIVTMFIYFGLPILGWICTLVAMRFYKLTKPEMVEVQKRIQVKKQPAPDIEAQPAG
ncbi:MFS transporter [Ruminococcaceae bacterium OttesenSCG-928-A11]|nr:MFS transporter [Ruminococcaceae bacterium OttesenSCG-928-A11]